MDTTSIVALLIVAAIVALVVFRVVFWPRLRRLRILARPFPEQWLATLEQVLPFYKRMDKSEQESLKQQIQLFIADKSFVGCAGQEIDDEIRLTIAAQACLLTLNRPGEHYQELRSVLIYPSTFVAVRDVRDELGLVSTSRSHLLGESWDQGKVVLAWDHVIQGVRNLEDGHNVVLHEFAHQLDSESGSTNGAPVLLARGAYKSWAEVFHREYEELRHDAALNVPSLLDKYGATNPAEFFAVATETFFERPRAMASHHPELYQKLAEFYGLQPANWHHLNL